MKKLEMSLDVLRIATKVLGYTETKLENVVMNLKSGRMTVKLYVFDTPEGQVLVNLSNTKSTLQFDTKEKYKSWLDKKCEVYDTDKEMWQDFTGMDDETWEEWNK